MVNEMKYNASCKNGTMRIPLALQAVFLSGNRGHVVNAPPPDKAAMKTFRRWGWQIRTLSSTSNNTMSTKADLVDVEKPKQLRRIQKVKITKSSQASTPTLSPQDYLDGMLKSRGYSTTKHSTLSTAYYNKPSQFQLASYGVYMIDLIKYGDVQGLQEVMNLGISPNACNTHGESIVHNVCRRSNDEMLEVLLQSGCEIQVSDDNGRTPMHDACWTTEPNFLVIEKLLQRDTQLLYLTDNHGFLPLSYIRKDHWSEWLQFLESKKDVYWPRKKVDVLDLTLSMPLSRPICDPEKTLSLELTRMVAGGKLKPDEVQYLLDDAARITSCKDYDHVISISDDDYDSDDDDSFADDYDDDDDASICSILEFSESSNLMRSSSNLMQSSWSSVEMNEVLNSLSTPSQTPLPW